MPMSLFDVPITPGLWSEVPQTPAMVGIFMGRVVGPKVLETPNTPLSWYERATEATLWADPLQTREPLVDGLKIDLALFEAPKRGAVSSVARIWGRPPPFGG